MGIIFDEPKRGNGVGFLQVDEPEAQLDKPKQETPLLEQFATVAQDNVVGRLITDPTATLRLNRTEDRNYNPFDNGEIAGYEDQASRFANVLNAEQTLQVKRQIDREKKVDAVLEDSSWMGLKGLHVLGQVVADPITYVPIAGILGKTGSIAARATRGAAYVGATGAASSIVDQASKGTFDAEQFTGTTAISALLGAVLGPVLGKAATAADILPAEKAMKTHVNSVLRSMNEPPRPIGELAEHAARQELYPDEALLESATRNYTLKDPIIPSTIGTNAGDTNKLVGATLSAEKVGRNWGPIPLLRVANSQSSTARAFIDDFANNNLYREGNALGIANKQSADLDIALWKARTQTAIDDITTEWKDYVARVPSVERAFKKVADFQQEVTLALRRGGSHSIPEVANAARIARSILNKNGQLAEEAGVLKMLEAEFVGAADGNTAKLLEYVTRRWNPDNIKMNRELFVSKIAADFQRVDPTLSAVDAIASAQRVAETLTGFKVDDDIIQGVVPKASATKTRVLDIKDTEYEDFLDNDIVSILESNTHQLSRETEWVKRFGNRQMNEIKEIVQNDYRQLMIGKSVDEQNKLQSEMKSVIADMESLRDRYFGLNRKGNEAWHNISSAVLAYQTVRLLGGVVVSSLADVARPVYFHGFARYASTLADIGSNVQKFKGTTEAMKKFGVAVDAVKSSELNELAENMASGKGATREVLAAAISGFEVKGVKVPGFSKLTLIDQWTRFWKNVSGVLAQDFIIESSQKWTAGAIDENSLTKMAMLGIDQSMAARIVEQGSQFGWNNEGLFLNDLARWTDEEAADTVRRAILKSVDTTINTPNKATKPMLWNAVDNDTANLILQFKSFPMSAHVQSLIPALQMRDAAVYQGMLMTMIGGTIVAHTKAFISGKDAPEGGNLVRESIDASGLFALPFMFVNPADKLMGLGITDTTDSMAQKRTYKRYQDINEMGLVLGPTAGQAIDLSKTAGNWIKSATGEGDVSWKDLQNMRSAIPLQNLFYIRGLFDTAQYETAKQMGVKIPAYISQREEGFE